MGRGQVTWLPPDWSGSAAPSPRDDVIYVLLVHGDGGWREVSQTSGRRARLPQDTGGVVRARLLVVTQQGLAGMSEAHLHLDSYHTHHPSPDFPYGHRVNTATRPEPLPPPSPAPTDAAVAGPAGGTLPDPYPSSESPTAPPSLASTQHLPPHHHTSSNPTPQATSVDPSWSVEVENVEVGALAEVQLRWGERGGGGAEYLLSWAEKAGFVSGHLLTRHPATHLSLWPGQAYNLQVELVDVQGNAVLKSLPTPITFPSAPAQSSTSPPSSPTTNILPPASPPSTTTTLALPVVTRGLHQFSPQETRVLQDTLPPSSVTPWEDLNIPEFVQDQAGQEPKQESKEQLHTITGKDSELRDEIPKFPMEDEAEVDKNSLGGGERAGLGVAQEEQEKVYHVTVWCVGVGVGALLLLTFCSMVVWLLNRCRKSNPHQQPQQTVVEDYEQQRVDTLRESVRMYVAQQRNQTSSWTFENFCSVARKGCLDESQREEGVGVPAGIDNASLMENYVFMLDAPPPPSFIKR